MTKDKACKVLCLFLWLFRYFYSRIFSVLLFCLKKKIHMDTRGKYNVPSALISPNEVPVQMSPFSDERWDLDEQENRRRREIHREYVMKQRWQDKAPNAEPPTPPNFPPPQPDNSASNLGQEVNTPETPANIQCPPTECGQASAERNFLEFEPESYPKPTTFEDIKFDVPRPPNLFPVLNCPQVKIKPDVTYNLPANEKWYYRQENNSYELPPKPQFSVFKNYEPEKPKVQHYGINVPFWQFPSRTNHS